jgi:Na+-driven multidrug efflux pump
MMISLVGAMVFIATDWLLIFGNCGCPQLGLLGSSCATVFQYGIMSSLAFIYIFFSGSNNRFNIRLFARLRFGNIYRLIKLSLPVIIDKAILAVCSIWLARLMISVTTQSYADSLEVVKGSFVTIKDIERCAIIPGVAFAQVITFLVSNDYKKGHFSDIKVNIKKILFLASVVVSSLLAFICFFPRLVIEPFDKTGIFTQFAVQAIPFISILVFFDVIQVVLSAALRGAAHVKTVMWIRLVSCCGFFIPVSYGLSLLHIDNPLIHFVVIYASFYGSHAVMCYLYVTYLRSDKWKVSA